MKFKTFEQVSKRRNNLVVMEVSEVQVTSSEM